MSAALEVVCFNRRVELRGSGGQESRCCTMIQGDDADCRMGFLKMRRCQDEVAVRLPLVHTLRMFWFHTRRPGKENLSGLVTLEKFLRFSGFGVGSSIDRKSVV